MIDPNTPTDNIESNVSDLLSNLTDESFESFSDCINF